MSLSKAEYKASKALFIKRLEALKRESTTVERAPCPDDACGWASRGSEKARAVDAYGGICANCSEAELSKLELNHVNDNGKAHRMMLSKGRAGKDFYIMLRRAGYPNAEPYLLEVLCVECHRITTSINNRRKSATRTGKAHTGRKE
jgi:hypothetical protein